MDRLRDVSRTPFDPSTTHGTMSAQVALAMPLKPDLPPGSTNYSIAVDATNFSAENLIMGQRLDAAALHVTATRKAFSSKATSRSRAPRPIWNTVRRAMILKRTSA